MGCGGSKTESGRDTVNSKFPPLLRRRFEEIRGRRHAAEQGTLSKKELLKEGINDDDQSMFHSGNIVDDNNHRKSVCSPEESNLRAAKVTPEPEPEQQPERPADTFDDAVLPDIKEEGKALVEETEEAHNGEEGEEEEEEEQEEDQCRLSNVDSRNEYLCPSSPSFRVYYIESLNNVNDEDDKYVSGKDDDDTSQSQKSLADADSEEVVALVDRNRASDMKMKEKGKKGRRFRMVMCKRRPAAIKSLMNVASCYHPSSSRHDKARLLAPKPEAS